MSLSIQAFTKRVPAFAAVAAALVGLVNIASTLTPNIRWRGHLLLEFEPVEAIRLFHALSLPAGAALLLVAPYLAKRRRRALQTAVALMIVLGLFDLLKGLDFEETILTWGVAVVLILSRDAFTVRHDPNTLRSAVWRVPVLALIGLAIAMVAIWTGSHASFGTVATETFDLLRYQPGPIHFHHHIPIGIHMLELGTLLVIAYVIFRPLTVPRAPPSPAARQVASDLVRAHGADTLAFFKLRADGHYIFGEDRRAFVAYAIENGVLLLSGDPVGPRDALPGLLQQVREFADARGLKLGALGASEQLCPLYEELGLRAIYLGDEAVVELDRFSLEGRPIRKVRQSVTPSQQGGLRGRAARAAHARPEHDRAGRRGGRAGSPGRPRARLLDGDGVAPGRARSRDARGAGARRGRARSAASCTSCPATAAPPCRCRSCGAIRRLPTG